MVAAMRCRQIAIIKPGKSETKRGAAMNFLLYILKDGHYVFPLPELYAQHRPNTFCQS